MKQIDNLLDKAKGIEIKFVRFTDIEGNYRKMALADFMLFYMRNIFLSDNWKGILGSELPSIVAQLESVPKEGQGKIFLAMVEDLKTRAEGCEAHDGT